MVELLFEVGPNLCLSAAQLMTDGQEKTKNVNAVTLNSVQKVFVGPGIGRNLQPPSAMQPPIGVQGGTSASATLGPHAYAQSAPCSVHQRPTYKESFRNTRQQLPGSWLGGRFCVLKPDQCRVQAGQP